MEANHHTEVVLGVGEQPQFQVEEKPFVGAAKFVLNVVEPDEIGVCVEDPKVSGACWTVLIVKVAASARSFRTQREDDRLDVVVGEVIRSHLALAVFACIGPVATRDQGLQLIEWA